MQMILVAAPDSSYDSCDLQPIDYLQNFDSDAPWLFKFLIESNRSGS